MNDCACSQRPLVPLLSVARYFQGLLLFTAAGWAQVCRRRCRLTSPLAARLPPLLPWLQAHASGLWASLAPAAAGFSQPPAPWSFLTIIPQDHVAAAVPVPLQPLTLLACAVARMVGEATQVCCRVCPLS